MSRRRGLNVCLLGAFSARPRDSGPPLRFKTRKAEALFAYLAVHREQPQRRDWLIELLWRDVPPSQGRHSLRQTLLTMRSALGAEHTHHLVTEDDDVVLRGPLRVDITTFERLARRGTLDSTRIACELYQHDLMAGFVLREVMFDAWLAHERERLRGIAIDVMERRITGLMGAGALQPALQLAQRLVALAPLSETGQRALIMLYAQTGRPNAAFQQYDEYARLLGETLGIPPDQETQHLVRTLYAQRLPPPRS